MADNLKKDTRVRAQLTICDNLRAELLDYVGRDLDGQKIRSHDYFLEPEHLNSLLALMDHEVKLLGLYASDNPP